MYNNHRGFSLLEILIAFVILALSLGVMMRIFSGGLRNAGIADDYGQALYIAESKLAVLGIETPFPNGSQNGEVDGRFQWRTSIHPYEDASISGANTQSRHSIYRILVEVRWHNFGVERSVSLASLRLAPRQ